MKQTAVRQHARSRWWLRIVLTLAALEASFLILTAARILHTASQQDLHRADAIVVFGAAEYAGRPSPVYRARLDHAYDLFTQGLAPVVITSGGSGADPTYSEGGVGHDYLMHRGIPDASLIAETQGSDTAESARRIGVIMRANKMHSCLAVSDQYHVFRIRELLEHEGVRVFVAPRPDSLPHSAWQRVIAVTREAVSYTAWRFGL